MYSFWRSGLSPFPSGIATGDLRYRKGLVRKRVIEVKKSVEELKKLKSHATIARGYTLERSATHAEKSAIRKHHSNIDPSIPPQIAVIL
jgi:hypothetical protein